MSNHLWPWPTNLGSFWLWSWDGCKDVKIMWYQSIMPIYHLWELNMPDKFNEIMIFKHFIIIEIEGVATFRWRRLWRWRCAWTQLYVVGLLNIRKLGIIYSNILPPSNHIRECSLVNYIESHKRALLGLVRSWTRA